MTGRMSQLFRPERLGHLPKEDVRYPAEPGASNDKGGRLCLRSTSSAWYGAKYQRTGILGSTSVLIGVLVLAAQLLYPKYWSVLANPSFICTVTNQAVVT